MHGVDFLKNREVVIVSGARTPFGANMGSLSGISATELAVHASKVAIQKLALTPKTSIKQFLEMLCNQAKMQLIWQDMWLCILG